VSEPSADPPESVVYLDVDDALEVFGAIIGGTATQAADQLRDRAALAGALARPINYAQYENADLALQAATLAHGIAETQPFIDGNKRAALVVMFTFLEINGCRVQASDRALAEWIIAFSAGASHHEVAELVRARLTAGG
jgi:death-on-curing family protein